MQCASDLFQQMKKEDFEEILSVLYEFQSVEYLYDSKMGGNAAGRK